MSKKALSALLGDRIIGYHPILAKIGGGAAEGVLLSQLLYWESKMDAARGAAWDGWFWKVAHELYGETGMARSEFETARANLIKRGFIEYESRGTPMRAHYRLNLDAIAAALESADEFAKEHARKFLTKEQTPSSSPDAPSIQDTPIQFAENEHVENEHVENSQANLSKMSASVCRKSANLNVQNRQTIQEITTSNYQKNSMNRDGAIAEVQNQLRENFHFPFDASWDWLRELWDEIPDIEFLKKHVQRTRDMQPHTIFDRRGFIRSAKNSFARAAFQEKSLHG